MVYLMSRRLQKPAILTGNSSKNSGVYSGVNADYLVFPDSLFFKAFFLTIFFAAGFIALGLACRG